MQEAQLEQEEALLRLAAVMREYGEGWRQHKSITGVLAGVLRRTAESLEQRDDEAVLQQVRAQLAAVQAKLATRPTSPRNAVSSSSPLAESPSLKAALGASGSLPGRSVSPRRAAPPPPLQLDMLSSPRKTAVEVVGSPRKTGAPELARVATSGGVMSSHRQVGSPRSAGSAGLPLCSSPRGSAAREDPCDSVRAKLAALRAGHVTLPTSGHAGELADMLRGTLAVKSRKAVEQVLACHLAALPWDSIEAAASLAYSKLYFRSAFDPQLAPVCEQLLVLIFEHNSSALDRVKRAAIEAQLRGAARAKAESMGVAGALHLQSSGGVHVFDCGILLADGKTFLGFDVSLVPAVLRGIVRDAQRRWIDGAHFGVPLSLLCAQNPAPALVFRLCNSLRMCKIPLSLADSQPERLARMRQLFARRVMPSLKRHANSLALLLEFLRELPQPLLPANGNVTDEAEACVLSTLSLVAGCFADLVSSRCISLPCAAVMLCRVLVRGQSCLSAMLSMQRLIMDRSTLLPPCTQALAMDPFVEIVG